MLCLVRNKEPPIFRVCFLKKHLGFYPFISVKFLSDTFEWSFIFSVLGLIFYFISYSNIIITYNIIVIVNFKLITNKYTVNS